MTRHELVGSARIALLVTCSHKHCIVVVIQTDCTLALACALLTTSVGDIFPLILASPCLTACRRVLWRCNRKERQDRWRGIQQRDQQQRPNLVSANRCVQYPRTAP
jgi:hypothetical protein